MTISPHTLDQAAVAIMLSDRPQATKVRALRALSEEVTRAVHKQHECPECGSTQPKDDNQLPADHFDYTLLCPECGEQWSPNL